MARHNLTGTHGEDIAAEYLTAKGYAIVERNWRSGRYELDIIASKGSRIVFVEVKTRSNPDDDPIAAVDSRKSLRLIRAALAYMEQRSLPHDIQFDLIAVTGTPPDCTVEHIEDAFTPPLRTY